MHYKLSRKRRFEKNLNFIRILISIIIFLELEIVEEDLLVFEKINLENEKNAKELSKHL